MPHDPTRQRATQHNNTPANGETAHNVADSTQKRTRHRADTTQEEQGKSSNRGQQREQGRTESSRKMLRAAEGSRKQHRLENARPQERKKVESNIAESGGKMGTKQCDTDNQHWGGLNKLRLTPRRVGALPGCRVILRDIQPYRVYQGFKVNLALRPTTGLITINSALHKAPLRHHSLIDAISACVRHEVGKILNFRVVVGKRLRVAEISANHRHND